MIREDFMEILNYLRKSYLGKIILSTNSLLINEKNAKELGQLCDSFEISIDGVNEQTCALVRGEGVFDKVCSRIALLKRFGIDNINLSMVFSDKNEDLMTEFRDLNKRLGTNPICRIFSPIGRGEKNKALFSDKGNEDIYIPHEYLEQSEKPFGISTCSAGRCELFIGEDGTLYPCPSYMSKSFAMGNVLDVEKIDELLKNDPDEYVCEHVARIHPNNLSKCNDCDVKLFCWTCPGELSDIKSRLAFEKRCKITRPILRDRVWKVDKVY